MIKQLLLGAFTLVIVAAPAAQAQSQPTDEYGSQSPGASVDSPGAFSQGAPGEFGSTSATTNNFRRTDSFATTDQRLPDLHQTTTAILSRISGPVGRNGLPMTSTDSFVLNSGGQGELIFGGEGTDGVPPYNEFTEDHRIERGIQGERAEGLTTFHGSLLPSAWGNDEFIGGTEWLQAGRSGGLAGRGPAAGGGAFSGMSNRGTGSMFSHSDMPGNSSPPQLGSSRRFASQSGGVRDSGISGQTMPAAVPGAVPQNTAPDPGF